MKRRNLAEKSVTLPLLSLKYLIILLRLERLLRLENLSQPDADKYCAGDNHFKHGHIYAQK